MKFALVIYYVFNIQTPVGIMTQTATISSDFDLTNEQCYKIGFSHYERQIKVHGKKLIEHSIRCIPQSI